MTHDISQFSSFYKIKPITVKLPNNSTVIAEFAGTKIFSESFIIFNVLYIPEFSFNIISIQTLIKDSNCKLIFSCEQCQIHDNHSYKIIGHASMIRGLYYLDENTSNSRDRVFVNTTMNYSKKDINVWHYRLGHPCNNALRQICRAFPYVHDSCKNICDICHYSKQHRLPFPHNTTTSDNCFDLIHVDIWGPISIPSIHGHKCFLTVVDDLSRHT